MVWDKVSGADKYSIVINKVLDNGNTTQIYSNNVTNNYLNLSTIENLGSKHNITVVAVSSLYNNSGVSTYEYIIYNV